MKNSGKKRILVIEDEEHISEGIRLNLALKGYDVIVAPDGVSGLRDWKEWKPDLIVLDIMLPGIDGFSVLKSVRLEDERLPILILSARGEAEYRVKGLTCGVDDYLTKPFNLDEFLLRIDRLLARDSWGRLSSDPFRTASSSIASTYSFGGNVVDFERFTADCKCGRVILTELEIRLLKLFIANRGKPLSRNELLEIGWGYTGATPTRTVDNFIVRFRKYFETNPRHPVFFKSLRSVGYLFDHD